MLDAGFPKKETCKVVGAKYSLSYPTVLKILKEAECGKASNTAGKACGKASDTTLDTVGKASNITSADIVDGIIKKFGKKGDDYIDAFNRAPKDTDGAIVMKNGSKVYF